MTRYRFTADDFRSKRGDKSQGIGDDYEQCHCAAMRANALLEQWERKSKVIYYGHPVYTYGDFKCNHDTHIAILWNPQLIKKEGE